MLFRSRLHFGTSRGALQAAKTSVQTNTSDQTDRAAPRAFYLAIARSAVCASPVPHNSSLSCDLTRIRRSAQAAVSVQTHCSRYVDSLAGRTCVHVRQMDRNQDAGAASAVPVVC